MVYILNKYYILYIHSFKKLHTMASTLEIPTGMSATPQNNIDRSMNQGTKIFVDRKNNQRFSQTDIILQNMTEFNNRLVEYLSNIGIPLKPLNYGTDELPQFNYEEIANLGYSEYKSFTTYILENVSDDQIKLIKSTKDTSKTNGTAYDLFTKQCLPYIYIEFNKGFYFNVNVLKNGKYKNERGTGERLIFFADGLVTKYQVSNQEERNNKTVGSQNLKLKDIMPNITCDVKQPSQRGKKTVLALQFLNDIYKLTFTLFKDDIVAPLQISGPSVSKSKKQQQIDHLNDHDQILFKDKSYTKTNPETQEKSVIEYTIFDLKLLGKPDNNLQSIITNTNESDTDQPMVVDGHNINLDNIDIAFPRGVLISTWINMESVTYVPTQKHLYWNFKCYQIDVDRRYISLSTSSSCSLDIRSLCKNNETPQIFDINKSPESKADVFLNEDDDNENDDNENDEDDN